MTIPFSYAAFTAASIEGLGWVVSSETLMMSTPLSTANWIPSPMASLLTLSSGLSLTRIGMIVASGATPTNGIVTDFSFWSLQATQGWAAMMLATPVP